ncbi:MAG: ATPase, T2SS/T4P/T4SS family [Pseudomonadales bacterium]
MSLNIRLLDSQTSAMRFNELGYDDWLLEQLIQVLEGRDKDGVEKILQGLIVFNGSTGSGKTASLYSSLRHLMSCNIELVSIEDPVEIDIPGLRQMEVVIEIGVESRPTSHRLLVAPEGKFLPP